MQQHAPSAAVSDAGGITLRFAAPVAQRFGVALWTDPAKLGAPPGALIEAGKAGAIAVFDLPAGISDHVVRCAACRARPSSRSRSSSATAVRFPVGSVPEEHGEGAGMLSYLSGFGNEFATEALPGALPAGQNFRRSRCPYGLYAEQLSGTAFTAPRAQNRRSWLYRIRPAVTHRSRSRASTTAASSAISGAIEAPPNQLRWDPLDLPSEPVDFIEGLVTMAGNGNPRQQLGCGIHEYVANRSMQETFFYDADGELLIVPQTGALRIATELGTLEIAPLEVAVIPRGIRFRVELLGPVARGFTCCENYGSPVSSPSGFGTDRFERFG